MILIMETIWHLTFCPTLFSLHDLTCLFPTLSLNIFNIFIHLYPYSFLCFHSHDHYIHLLSLSHYFFHSCLHLWPLTLWPCFSPFVLLLYFLLHDQNCISLYSINAHWFTTGSVRALSMYLVVIVFSALLGKVSVEECLGWMITLNCLYEWRCVCLYVDLWWTGDLPMV